MKRTTLFSSIYSLCVPSCSFPRQGRSTETNVSDFHIKERSELHPMFCLPLRINRLITKDMQRVEDAVTSLLVTLDTNKINRIKL